MHTRKIISALATAVCCAALLQSCVKGRDREAQEQVKVGDTVPSFSVTLRGPTPSGEDIRYFTHADFTGRKSVIVLFTARCPHCKALLPIVDAVWKEIKEDADYQIVPIAREETENSVEALWNTMNLSMPCYLDPDKSAYGKFADKYVPRIYYINEQGVVAWMQTGEEGITKEFLLEDVLGYTAPVL